MTKSNSRVFSAAFILLAALAWARPAAAQFFVGPAASAMGSAGIAGVDEGETPLLNPASLAFLQAYYATALVGVGKHDGEGNHSQWGLLLADGSPGNVIPGALSYVRRRVDMDGGVSDTQQDLQITLAGRPLQYFAFGITAHRQVDQILSRTMGAEYTQWNGNVGAVFVLNQTIGLGLVGYDVLPSSSSVPVGVRVRRAVGFGFNYAYEKTFRARLDLVRPEESQRDDVRVGLETYFNENFIFRIGGRWREPADQTYVTTGLGYHGPRLSFDYSFQKDVRGGENGRHLFDLWLPL